MSKIVARREAVYGLYRYGDFVAIARKTGLSAPTVSRALRGAVHHQHGKKDL